MVLSMPWLLQVLSASACCAAVQQLRLWCSLIMVSGCLFSAILVCWPFERFHSLRLTMTHYLSYISFQTGDKQFLPVVPE